MGVWQCSNMKQHFHFWRFWWFLGSPKATPYMNRWLITVYGIGAEKLRFEATRNISSWDPSIAFACPSSCKSERIPMIHDDFFLGKIGEHVGKIVLNLVAETTLWCHCSILADPRRWVGSSMFSDPFGTHVIWRVKGSTKVGASVFCLWSRLDPRIKFGIKLDKHGECIIDIDWYYIQCYIYIYIHTSIEIWVSNMCFSFLQLIQGIE